MTRDSEMKEMPKDLSYTLKIELQSAPLINSMVSMI